MSAYRTERTEIAGDELPAGTIFVDMTARGPVDVGARVVIVSEPGATIGMITEDGPHRTVCEVWDKHTMARLEKPGTTFLLVDVPSHTDTLFFNIVERN